MLDGFNDNFGWIKGINDEFKVFVENRVIEIRKNVAPKLWRYCNTKENPAGLITRDGSSINNNLWWHGPLFLTKDVEHSKNVSSDFIMDEDSLTKMNYEKKAVLITNIDVKKALAG